MSANPATARGVLYPASLTTFHRVPATGDLAVFLRWFWIAEWSIEPGRTSRQHVVGFPGCNLVVEDTMTGIAGPTMRASYRDLTGTGWAVGALLRPAAVPALVDDLALAKDSYFPVDLPGLTRPVRAAMNAQTPGQARRNAATSAFADWILNEVGVPSDEALLANRMVEAAETDPSLLTVTDLAAHLRVSTRGLQRLAAKYVGLPPAALIRRRRLQEAVELLRRDPGLDLTTLAHQLGYADHAHLTTDFRTTLGFTPSTYRGALPAE